MHRRQFPSEGLVRLSEVLAPSGPIPVSKSQFWSMIAETGFPRAVKLSPRVTVFYAEEIQQLMSNPENWGGHLGKKDD